jgi:hypothetical protein
MSLTTSDNRRNIAMLTSNGFKVAMIIAAVATGSIVSPALAQSLHHRDGTGKDRQIIWQDEESTSSRSGRNAFGMAPGLSFQRDPNSPAATGGGSLGYNQKLLDY